VEWAVSPASICVPGWTGPWWGNYFMTLEPQGSVDAPQLATLAGHL